MICGGGVWDRDNPVRDERDPLSAFPDRPHGRDGAHTGGTHGPGDTLFPFASRVGGGAGPRPGARHISRRRQGRKGASHALALLRQH